MIDFSPSQRSLELAMAVREFVEEIVYPLEREAGAGELPAAKLEAARAVARERGLWAPQLPAELGGGGLDLLDAAAVLEEAGRSLIGPLALGCSAPDEGNAHLLHLAAAPEQRERYLAPLAAGKIRSTFCMTEPAPGAGADPTMMRTRARRDGDAWVLEGDKWFATGAAGAAFAIVAAVSDPEAKPRDGMTLFVVDADNPGYHLVRKIPTLGGGTPGGHCEVELRECRVDASAVLGEVGGGYALLQRRLGPARLTHCMRWLGAATRALELAAERALEREAFGRPLSQHQAVQWSLADSAIELRAGRLLVQETAWRVARGEEARVETSAAKVHVAEAVHRAIDRALQVFGGLGMSHDTPIALFWQESRGFRIYDGPSEVHRMVVAREILRSAAARCGEERSR